MRCLAVLAVVFVAAACSSTPQPTPGPSVGTFENDVMSFEYPGNWNVLVPESGDPALALLSTEVLAQTEPRIEKLNGDGVYVAWTERPVSPVATPKPNAIAATEVEVGGRPAVASQADADGDCKSIAGDQIITVIIDTPGSKPDVQMQACIKGPNLELTSAAIAGMLASVGWKN